MFHSVQRLSSRYRFERYDRHCTHRINFVKRVAYLIILFSTIKYILSFYLFIISRCRYEATTVPRHCYDCATTMLRQCYEVYGTAAATTLLR